MKKFYCFIALASLCAFSSQAAPLRPEQALQRALSDEVCHMASRDSNLSLAKTAVSETGENLYYIFNRSHENGFMIVSADDRFAPVLGYSDAGSFLEEDAPANFKWWISEYAREIEWYLAHEDQLSKACVLKAPEKESRHAVEPLLATKWNQGDPYNKLCPTWLGERTVTGCVATSLAQVMKYHEWPQGPGNGSHSYLWNGQTLSFDFSEYTFDWENMLLGYGGATSTISQKKAIANLMYACGVSVEMKYDISSNGGSGAYSLSQVHALKEFFGYDSRASYIKKEYVSPSQWSDIVYHELEQSRPVLYNGSGSQGGHSFVCDGYQGNEYFHFNWGWEGSSDGYFLLNALNPGSLGIGGGGGGFNTNQGVSIGVGRPGEVDIEEIYPIFFYKGMNAELIGNQAEGYHIMVSDDEGFFNWSASVYTGKLGVCLRKEGKIVKYIEDINPEETVFDRITPNGEVSGQEAYMCAIDPSELEPGKYFITPAFKRNGNDWKELLIKNNGVQRYTMTVNPDGTLALTPNGEDFTMEVTDFYPEHELETGNPAKFVFKCKNGYSAYDSTMALFAKAEEEEAVKVIEFHYMMDADTEQEFGLTFDLAIPGGTYDFYVTDGAGAVVSDYHTYAVKGIDDSGMASMENEDLSGPVEYFTLEGIKTPLSELKPGLYIRRQGTTATKIIIR